jgi:hypothetical protein
MGSKIGTSGPSAFFCSMCWRPRSAVKKQSKLCNLHATSDDAKEYKRRRRRLEKLAKEKKLDVEVDQIVRQLCIVIKSPDTLSKELVTNANHLPWSDLFKKMLLLLSPHYENTVHILNEIGFIKSVVNDEAVYSLRATSALACTQLLIRHFDKRDSNTICDDYQHLSEGITSAEQYRMLVHLIARLEVDSRFKLTEPLRRGPKSVSKLFNVGLYTELLNAIEEKEDLGITIRVSEIAKRHSVSKQAAHEKLTRLIANPEHYIKRISDFKKLKNKT